MPTPERIRKVEQVLSRRQADLSIVCENIHDPHNVAAILRSCDAFGVHRVHMLYTFEPPPNWRKVGRKSSGSARKWLDIRTHRDLESCFTEIRNEGLNILASRKDPKSRTAREQDLSRPTAIVLGNEHRGVSDEVLDYCDGLIWMPMHGMVQSLNVSVAAAILLYEAARQRDSVGRYDTPTLSAKERTLWSKKWLGEEP